MNRFWMAFFGGGAAIVLGGGAFAQVSPVVQADPCLPPFERGTDLEARWAEIGANERWSPGGGWIDAD